MQLLSTIHVEASTGMPLGDIKADYLAAGLKTLICFGTINPSTLCTKQDS